MLTTLTCLAMAIYMEARAEPERGQIKVGLVVLNRAEEYKMEPCQVLKVPHQFSWYRNTNSLTIKPKDVAGWNTSLDAAKDALVLHSFQITYPKYFHNHTVRPRWAKYKVKVATIGNHTFYADKKGG